MLCMKGASSSDAVFLLPLLAHFWPEHSNLNLNLNLNLISNKNQIILLLLNVSISVPLWAISEKISNKRARVSLFQTFPRFFPSFYKLFFQFYLTLSLSHSTKQTDLKLGTWREIFVGLCRSGLWRNKILSLPFWCWEAECTMSIYYEQDFSDLYFGMRNFGICSMKGKVPVINLYWSEGHGSWSQDAQREPVHPWLLVFWYFYKVSKRISTTNIDFASWFV